MSCWSRPERRSPGRCCTRDSWTSCCCTWRRSFSDPRRVHWWPSLRCNTSTMRPPTCCSACNSSAMICGCACGLGRLAVRKRPGSTTLFTGIVQDVGRVAARESRDGDERLTIDCERLDLSRLSVGDSVCVQGCCLTVIEISDRAFSADLSRETLSRTTLGALAVGSL